MHQPFYLILLVSFSLGAGKCFSQRNDSIGNLEKKWWKEAIVYQINPRSFKDSDGDGGSSRNNCGEHGSHCRLVIIKNIF